jgi:hypothetical protein
LLSCPQSFHSLTHTPFLAGSFPKRNIENVSSKCLFIKERQTLSYINMKLR